MKRGLLFFLILLAAALIALGCAVTRRPAWFRPQAVDYRYLDQDKRDFVRLLDDIGEALNTGRSIRVVLDERQVNRWLAERRELPHSDVFEFEGLNHPQISLLEGDRVRIGGATSWRGFEVVLSCDLELQCSDDLLRVVAVSADAGALRLPRGWVVRVVSNAFRSSSFSSDDGTASIANRLTWPNGERRFRIEQLRISQGAAELVLTPTSTR